MVRKVVHKESGKYYVWKQVPKTMRDYHGKSVPIDWKIEVANAMQIDCPFVVRVVDYFETRTHGYIVMEYCEGGTLQEEVNRMKRRGDQYSESVCCFLFFHFASVDGGEIEGWV